MHKEILQHYHNVQSEAKQKLQAFKEVPHTEEALFEELAFCIFAANSSAKMAQKAVKLLKPVLHTGDVNAYKEQVEGKVRFYNIRSEYLAHNYTLIQETPLLQHIQQKKPRKALLTLKGIGMKEASHFLRNTGHSGYTILDKHIRDVAHQLGVFDDAEYESSYEGYVKKEKKLQGFCNKNNLDIDVLDLALWSYKTGEILK